LLAHSSVPVFGVLRVFTEERRARRGWPCMATVSRAPRLMRRRSNVQKAVRTLIRAAGDDPDREGLVETPARVERALAEWFSGYSVDPAQLLEARFDAGLPGGGEVFVPGIAVHSHCEHHFAPITGTACVAYEPLGKVCGLSKIARLVDAYARRLQLQERLTNQIASTMWCELEPTGVAVIIRATHACMTSRGAKQSNSSMLTTSFYGSYADPARQRDFIARSGLGYAG